MGLNRFNAAAALLLASGGAGAAESITLTLGDLSGPGWHLRDVRVAWDFAASEPMSAQVVVAAIEAEALPRGVRDLRVRCLDLTWSGPEIACSDGLLKAVDSALGPLSGRMSWRYRAATGAWEFDLKDLQWAGGSVQARGSYADDQWHLETVLKGVGADPLRALAGEWLETDIDTAGGTVDATVRIRGSGAAVAVVEAAVAVTDGAFNNAAGTRAGASLVLAMEGALRPGPDAWDLDLHGRFSGGELYIDPLYLVFPAVGLELDLQGGWAPDSRRLNIRRLRFRHPRVVELQGQGRLDFAGSALAVTSLELELLHAGFPEFYETYLQPALAGTVMAKLETAGGARGRLKITDGRVRDVALEITDLTARERNDLFGVQGARGAIRWRADGTETRSRLAWQSGEIYGFAVGAGELHAGARSDGFWLTQGARIPLLDGELAIDEWRMSGLGSASPEWEFNAVLTPVSMPRVSGILGWPTLAGRLSGVLPRVHYRDGRLAVDGVLLVRVFDGEITVENLALEQPFGRIPRLQADMQVTALILDALTGAFSFGKIEGRLSGHMDGLRMALWRPVAFDAKFATAAESDSRRRISQRALENLSSIGGGISGVLSRSFLRFFKDFPYQRLGLGCRLLNGVCKMEGVGPANGGYYIVKGTFLPPRVEVIGYADEVDWDRLVGQLQAVTKAEP